MQKTWDEATKLAVWNDVVQNSVLVPKEELIRLRLLEAEYEHLQNNGVDNWENYSLPNTDELEAKLQKELGVMEHEELCSGGLKLVDTVDLE